MGFSTGRVLLVSSTVSYPTEPSSSSARRDPLAIHSLPAEELLPLVYDQLRVLAAKKLLAERPGTLQPTALVHEAWIRMMGGDKPPRFDNDRHFFAAAAESMRRILIDRARANQAQKRGGGEVEKVELTEWDMPMVEDDAALLVMDQALQRLAGQEPEVARFINLRFFVGLTGAQAALVLGIPERTARRHWSYARAWLFREIQREQTGEG